MRDKILALFTSPRQDRYLFSFDMFILIIQFPSGFCSLLCHVGNQLTQLSHYPRTQHYTSYSLRRLFMMAVYQKQIKPFLSCIQRSYTYFRRGALFLSFQDLLLKGVGTLSSPPPPQVRPGQMFPSPSLLSWSLISAPGTLSAQTLIRIFTNVTTLAFIIAAM